MTLHFLLSTVQPPGSDAVQMVRRLRRMLKELVAHLSAIAINSDQSKQVVIRSVSNVIVNQALGAYNAIDANLGIGVYQKSPVVIRDVYVSVLSKLLAF